MKTSTDATHQTRAVAPARFRALATGVGQSQSMSASSGAMRAQLVANTMPAMQRAALVPTAGYPAGMGAPALDGGQFVDSEFTEGEQLISDDGC